MSNEYFDDYSVVLSLLKDLNPITLPNGNKNFSRIPVGNARKMTKKVEIDLKEEEARGQKDFKNRPKLGTVVKYQWTKTHRIEKILTGNVLYLYPEQLHSITPQSFYRLLIDNDVMLRNLHINQCAFMNSSQCFDKIFRIGGFCMEFDVEKLAQVRGISVWKAAQIIEQKVMDEGFPPSYTMLDKTFRVWLVFENDVIFGKHNKKLKDFTQKTYDALCRKFDGFFPVPRKISQNVLAGFEKVCTFDGKLVFDANKKKHVYKSTIKKTYFCEARKVSSERMTLQEIANKVFIPKEKAAEWRKTHLITTLGRITMTGKCGIAIARNNHIERKKKGVSIMQQHNNEIIEDLIQAQKYWNDREDSGHREHLNFLYTNFMMLSGFSYDDAVKKMLKYNNGWKTPFEESYAINKVSNLSEHGVYLFSNAKVVEYLGVEKVYYDCNLEPVYCFHCFASFDEKEYKKQWDKEHRNKGCKWKTKNLQERILELKRQGLSNAKIVTELAKEGIDRTVKCVEKHVKQLISLGIWKSISSPT